jgi:hypothetical protein
MKSKTLITKNLFELTPEQKQMSISMYGKVIKCLIAPYHSIKDIPLEPNNEVYVYPERDLNIQQRKTIVGVMANSAKEEICFVTSDVFIITDMFDGCCRILTPDGEIEEVPTKTFAANAHDILLTVLQDDNYVEKYKEGAKDYRNMINGIITAIEKKTMTQAEYDKNESLIDMIGEPVIAGPLRNMLREVKIIQEKFKKDEVTGVVEFTTEELEYLKERAWFKDNLTIKECLSECRKGTKGNEKDISILEELIDLQSEHGGYKEKLKENKKKKEVIAKELKMRHKIEYWLSEQDENKKIKNAFKA